MPKSKTAKSLPEMPAIAIIGGGMAGLAAAASLVGQGKLVTLFEAGATLGGRARGLSYNETRIDNGQHILLGAYHETLKLLKLAGVQEEQVLMRLPLELFIVDLLSSKNFILKTSPYLPAPLHMLWGLLSAHGVGLKDKFSAIRFMTKMKLSKFNLPKDQSLLALLQAHNQSLAFIHYLWEPLCLAALNTPINKASAQVFLNVLRDSFAKKKHDADALLAKTDLSYVISEPIAAYCRQQGCLIQTSSSVESILPNNNGGYQLKIRDKTHTFSHLIITCGPHQLKNISQALPKLATQTASFSYQPITTVYLQYAKDTKLPKPMTGLVNSLGQWVFDRGQICKQPGLIAVVISAHTPFKQTRTEIAKTISNELKQLFPYLKKPLWHKVITEKRATFSCDLGLNRPDNTTIYPNLFIAGDYTAGDYPATIEGAIRSGIIAARHCETHTILI